MQRNRGFVALALSVAAVTLVGVAPSPLHASNLIGRVIAPMGLAPAVGEIPATALHTSTAGATDSGVIASSENLSSDLIAADVTILAGVTLTTNGWSILASGTFDNLGTVVTGPTPSLNFPHSYGGSGGGSVSSLYPANNSNGLSTLAPGGASSAHFAYGGNGSTPAVPSLSSAVIAGWNSTGMMGYLAGAGGGAITGLVPGGWGANGIYIRAQTLMAGLIVASGGSGTGTCSGVGLSGGGGGGTVLLAYGSGGLSSGTIDVSGGAGALACTGNYTSGAGGSGQVLIFNYAATNVTAAAPSSPASDANLFYAVLAAIIIASAIILLVVWRRGSPPPPAPPPPHQAG